MQRNEEVGLFTKPSRFTDVALVAIGSVAPIIVFMKTLASPQIAGSTIGEGSMKTVNTGTDVPLEKCPFRAFPSRTLCVRLLT
jgi:hypothetical protein